jgi:hypothetical protein
MSFSSSKMTSFECPAGKQQHPGLWHMASAMAKLTEKK